jgi:hypothetical protein
MTDIELVIKIPEEMWERIKDGYVPLGISKYLKKGTPLPKGHGRLIDADALIDTLGCSDRDIYVKACIEEDAPTIIEANDAESEDK